MAKVYVPEFELIFSNVYLIIWNNFSENNTNIFAILDA